MIHANMPEGALEQTMLIAQCSLKYRQHVGAVQWSSPKARDGEVRGEQTTEKAGCFPLERGKSDCAVDWKCLAIQKVSVLTAAIAAFARFFIKKINQTLTF